MKHASSASLDNLDSLLTEIRKYPSLVERKPGIFYFKSGAFLHFHEDVSGLYADIKLDLKTFSRFPVTEKNQQQDLLVALGKALPMTRS